MVVSDQSDGEPAYAHPAAATMVRALRHRGHPVLLTRRLPRRGLAEHRAYLLAAVGGPYVLCLDDDVWLEPGTLHRLVTAIDELGCGFVGNAVHGLSYADDVRPETHRHYEEWAGPPTPERIRPGTPEWHRAPIHSAANLLHVTEKLRLPPGAWRAYKVSWIGGCVLYDRAKLVDSGGFDFWRRVPSGTRARTSPRSSPCWRATAAPGVLPSGAYHLESPTTVTERDVEAWEVVLADAGRPADGCGEQLPGGLEHLGHRHVGHERLPVRALAVAGPVRVDPRGAVDAADRAVHRPGGDRPVPPAQRRRPVDQVADPEDAHRRRAHRGGKVQRAGVVGDHQRAVGVAAASPPRLSVPTCGRTGTPAAATTRSTTSCSEGVPVTSTSYPSRVSSRATSAKRSAGQRRRVSVAPGCSATRGRWVRRAPGGLGPVGVGDRQRRRDGGGRRTDQRATSR